LEILWGVENKNHIMKGVRNRQDNSNRSWLRARHLLNLLIQGGEASQEKFDERTRVGESSVDKGGSKKQLCVGVEGRELTAELKGGECLCECMKEIATIEVV